MSISKSWVNDKSNQKEVTALYEFGDDTIEQIAGKLGTTYHNVMGTINHLYTKEQRKILKAKRYAASKYGDKNPSFGKLGSDSAKWQGECEGGQGYKTILTPRGRRQVHRIVAAKLVQVEDLNPLAVVHHIDKDPHNNSEHNLVICTQSGHQALHRQEDKYKRIIADMQKTINSLL